MNNYSFNLLIIILLFPLNVLGQTTNQEENMQDLENRIEIMEEQKELINERFRTKSEAIDLKFETLKQSLNDKHNTLEILLWLFGTVSIIGLLIMAISLVKYYFKLLSKADEIAQNKIDKKLESFFEDKKERFKELINLQIKENRLKSDSKITVVTPKNTDSSFVNNFFAEMGFENVKFSNPDFESNIHNETDILFINDENNFFNEEDIEDFTERMPKDVVFFYFGSKRLKINSDRFAYANLRFQIHGNLVNALRYQSFLK